MIGEREICIPKTTVSGVSITAYTILFCKIQYNHIEMIVSVSKFNPVTIMLNIVTYSCDLLLTYFSEL